MRTPPSTGPSAAPSTATFVQSEIPASRPPVSPPRSAIDAGSTSAAPSPWTQRKAISIGRFTEAAQPIDASGEEDEPRLRDAARVEPPGEDGDHPRGDRDDEVVRGDHPRDADERRVERAVEIGQRENDDRRVGERDRHRRRHRPDQPRAAISQEGAPSTARPGSPKPNRR